MEETVSFSLYLKNTANLVPLDIMHNIGDIKVGLFTVKERWQCVFPEAEIIEVDTDFENNDGFIIDGSFIPLEKPEIGIDIIYAGKIVGKWSKSKGSKEYKGIKCNYLYDFMLNNGRVLEFDISLKDLSDFDEIYGNVFVHKTAQIDKTVLFNAVEGPIIIDENTKVKYYSVIEGNVYIDKFSLLENALIRSNTHIGKVNKISGEIEESVFMDYVNKHHYGFIGHSYIGEWVNLGAGTTNSDLKNNYGNVKITIEDKTIETDSMKIGAFIGDHTKIAIGTMINTGTVIGAFSNIFGYKTMPKYVKPFSWGENSFYDFEKLRDTVIKVMRRRDVEASIEYINKIEKVWKKYYVKNT